MELAVRIAALCLVGALLGGLLRRSGGDMALVLALAVCGAVAALLVEPLGTLWAFLQEAAQWASLPTALFLPVVKTIAIALVCRTGSDLCRDAGESAIASALETGGALCALLVALPLFRSAWDLLRSLL